MGINEGEVAVDGAIQSWTIRSHIVRVAFTQHAHEKPSPIVMLKRIKDVTMILDIDVGDANIPRSERIIWFLGFGSQYTQTSFRNR